MTDSKVEVLGYDEWSDRLNHPNLEPITVVIEPVERINQSKGDSQHEV